MRSDYSEVSITRMLDSGDEDGSQGLPPHEWLYRCVSWRNPRAPYAESDTMGRVVMVTSLAARALVAAECFIGLHDGYFFYKDIIKVYFSNLWVPPTRHAFDNPSFKALRQISFSLKYMVHQSEAPGPVGWHMRDDVRSPLSIGLSHKEAVIKLCFVKHQEITTDVTPDQSTDIGCHALSGWRILVVKTNKAEVHISHQSGSAPMTGPEAFLQLLLSEMQEMEFELKGLSDAIIETVGVPADFPIRLETRDRLMFEDHGFGLSRRYFWATQTLKSIQQTVETLQNSLDIALPEKVWHGMTGTRHNDWPCHQGEDQTDDESDYPERMAHLRNRSNGSMDRLDAIATLNIPPIRAEISELLSRVNEGTAILVARKSVQERAPLIASERHGRSS